MRRRLPADAAMYTGDDLNYPALIKGDDRGISQALLGIFDPIAPTAAHELSHFAAGEIEGYHAAFEPNVPLSRPIFRAPTRFCKTGFVFMANLAGHQDHFTMVGGQESARSTLHLAEIVRLANAAGLFTDPDRAAARVRSVFAPSGVDAWPGSPRTVFHSTLRQCASNGLLISASKAQSATVSVESRPSGTNCTPWASTPPKRRSDPPV